MKKIITILILSIYVGEIYGQKDNEQIKVKGVLTNQDIIDPEDKLEDVSIYVYNYNELLSTLSSNKNGKFDFEIPANSYVTIVFEKKDFVTKRILFDTRTDIKMKYRVRPFDLEISLLNKIEGIDYGDMDFPITRIEYVEHLNDYSYAEKYTYLMLKKQEKILSLVEDKLL